LLAKEQQDLNARRLSNEGQQLRDLFFRLFEN